jgi:hypothetical protein
MPRSACGSWGSRIATNKPTMAGFRLPAAFPTCKPSKFPPADHFGDLTTKVPVLKSKTPDVTSAERFLVLPSSQGGQTQLCPHPAPRSRKRSRCGFLFDKTFSL